MAGDIAIVVPVVFALTHAPTWWRRMEENAERTRRERQREEERKARERWEIQDAQRRSEAAAREAERIAALPPPPPPPLPPTLKQLLDWALADYQDEQERIDAAYPSDSPQWKRRKNEAEREYNRIVQQIRMRSGRTGRSRSSDTQGGQRQLPGP